MAETGKINLKEQVAMLPLSPGVYQFVDRSGTIIYVGKAKSLRKRVSSYFVQSKEHSPKVRVLVKQIAAIRHIVVGSEADALLLESWLIKSLQPRYNILLEADQTQPNRETRLLELDNQFHRKAFEITGMEAHFDHMLGELQHVERIRKFSLQTNENKSVCDAHTRILEMVLHGTAEELGEALESHLNRYKLSVEQARSVHPEYFTEG